MRQWFDLRRTDRVIIDTGGARAGPKAERLIVFEFVPKPGSPAVNPLIAGRGDPTASTRR
jgi:hypothetical protein